jgi:dihydroorotate dehydrogenase (fumarate)
VQADFGLTSGVHTAQDMIKAVMAGASVAMVASTLLQNGVSSAAAMLADFEAWLEGHDYLSVSQMKGSMSQRAVAEPAAFERANYMKVLSSY